MKKKIEAKLIVQYYKLKGNNDKIIRRNRMPTILNKQTKRVLRSVNNWNMNK